MQNIAYLLALQSIGGLGPIKLKKLLDYYKDPKLVWLSQSKKIQTSLDPQSYAKKIKEDEINWVTIFDKDYPKLLKEIYDPPVVLYYKGRFSKKDQNAIAVVGTRNMTSYGKAVTKQLTKDLVAKKVTIVSGLARGVDTEAHKTALNAGGRTIAVLGAGLNKIYPPENKKLAEDIISSGVLISEFSPDSLPLPGNFPARNRIISGLSKAILVTEASEKSGSLITARFALEQGREVFAVPGPITSWFSRGPLNLIKDGAKPVTNAEEILEDLIIDL